MGVADDVLAGCKPLRYSQKNATNTMVAGRHQTFWPVAGMPGAGGYDTTLAGVALTNPVTGQIPFTNPSGGNKSRIIRWTAAHTTAGGMLLLCDRLWHNGGINITSATAQTVNSVAWPARDLADTTNGDGVLIALEVSTNVGAGTPTLTLGYTNQAGTAGRTATNVLATTASATVGACYVFGLQAGDTGVRSIQTYTQSATWTGGTVNLVAYRVIAAMPLIAAMTPETLTYIDAGGAEIKSGSVLYNMIIPSTTTAGLLMSTLSVTEVAF